MRITLLLICLSLSLLHCKKDEKSAPADDKGAATEAPPTTPPVEEAKQPEEPAEDPVLERGKYLAGLMGCEHCHTPFGPTGPDQSKRFAGGLEIPEVFGTWRSLNITQDKETGIGDWTDEQIIASIREGKRPDGEQLFPIMPYLFYNSMSDDDAKAMVAFLRTVEPVSNKVERAMDLKLPKIPAPPAKGEAPDKADPVAHGQYLASMMHCAACHTPMGPKGPDMSKAYAGGMKLEIPMMGEGALYTANLTSDEATGLGKWSDEEIIASMKQMKKRDGSIILGPMAMYQAGWFALEDEDAKAIVAFLRSLPAIENKVPESTFKPHPPKH
jgi:mono/diheme cytochrome c family protein